MTWEGVLLLWIQENLRAPGPDAALKAFTHLGDGGLLFLVVAVGLLCFPSTRRAGVTALAALALGALCTNVALKHLVARPRPWLEVAGLTPLVAERDPNSFPSGHTCAAFAWGVALLRTLPKRWGRVLALGTAVLMGLSRLYVGVHYPTDVLAGLAIGTVCALLAVALCRRLWPAEQRPGG